MLADFVAYAQQHDVELTFFINPYHYSYLHTLKETGHWPNFLSWKHALVKVLDTSKDGQAPLFDFSGFADFNMEHVPLDNDRQLMRWYWEPAHYNARLGEQILLVVLTRRPNHFGIQLTLDSISGKIAEDHAGIINTRERWLLLKSEL